MMSAIHSPLPMKQGVSPSFVWLPHAGYDSLWSFLTQHFAHIDATEWERRLLAGEVMDEKGYAYTPESPFPSGTCVYYYRSLINEIIIPFQEHIVYEDDDILVADKPHFLPTTPSGRFVRETLLSRLRERTNNPHLTALHRLDRETAGLVLLSKSPQTRGVYQALFAQRGITKIYEACARLINKPLPLIHQSRLVEHPEHFFLTSEAEGTPNSLTHIELMNQHHDNTTDQIIGRYKLSPVTGKKHQLRVHMAALASPILNDLFYPTPQPVGADDFDRPLQLLAKELSFVDPLTQKHRHFKSRLHLQYGQTTESD